MNDKINKLKKSIIKHINLLMRMLEKYKNQKMDFLELVMECVLKDLYYIDFISFKSIRVVFSFYGNYPLKKKQRIREICEVINSDLCSHHIIECSEFFDFLISQKRKIIRKLTVKSFSILNKEINYIRNDVFEELYKKYIFPREVYDIILSFIPIFMANRKINDLFNYGRKRNKNGDRWGLRGGDKNDKEIIVSDGGYCNYYVDKKDILYLI